MFFCLVLVIYSSGVFLSKRKCTSMFCYILVMYL